MANKLIKKGDVFFTSIGSIKCWGVGESKELTGVNCKTIDCTHGTIANPNTDNIIILVKYLGDGICEEMVSGIKVKVLLFGFTDDSLNDGNVHTYECQDKIELPLAECFLTYDDFLKAKYGTTKDEYYSDLEYTKKLVNKYPLLLKEDEYTFDITDSLKKEYLQHTDEERINAMKAKSEHGNAQAHEIDSLIDQIITREKVSDISNEEKNAQALNSLNAQIAKYQNEKVEQWKKK